MFNRVRGRRPSPAIVISIIALVMSMAGTATAARVLIKSSKQIKAGSVNSGDIKNNGIKAKDLRDGAVEGEKIAKGEVGLDHLESSARSAIQAAGTQASEAFRRSGPQNQEPDKSVRVATLDNLDPGTYAIFAKTILTPTDTGGGLFDQGKSVSGHCTLDAGGDKDEARALLATPGALSPGVLNLQITRSFGSAGTVGLDCDVTGARWNASDTSIIAVRVGKAPRSPVDG